VATSRGKIRGQYTVGGGKFRFKTISGGCVRVGTGKQGERKGSRAWHAAVIRHTGSRDQERNLHAYTYIRVCVRIYIYIYIYVYTCRCRCVWCLCRMLYAARLHPPRLHAPCYMLDSPCTVHRVPRISIPSSPSTLRYSDVILGWRCPNEAASN